MNAKDSIRKHRSRAMMTSLSNPSTVIDHANKVRNLQARKRLFDLHGRRSWMSR
jgi:hypothetical protein